MNKCQAIARINRIGNGFNGQNRDYTCTAEGTQMAAYTVTTTIYTDGRTIHQRATEMRPACVKHAAPKMAFRRWVNR